MMPIKTKSKVFLKEVKGRARFLVAVKRGKTTIPLRSYVKREDALMKIKRLKKTGLVK